MHRALGRAQGGGRASVCLPPRQQAAADCPEITVMKQLDICLRAAALALIGVLLAGCGAREPEPKGGPPGMRRLSEGQYRQTIADIFGADIKVSGPFEPEIR